MFAFGIFCRFLQNLRIERLHVVVSCLLSKPSRNQHLLLALNY